MVFIDMIFLNHFYFSSLLQKLGWEWDITKKKKNTNWARIIFLRKPPGKNLFFITPPPPIANGQSLTKPSNKEQGMPRMMSHQILCHISE